MNEEHEDNEKTTASSIVSMPVARTLAEREAKRITANALSLVDEVELCITEIIAQDDNDAWFEHSDPIFDEESKEGAITIDRVRLADMVREHAKASNKRFPQVEAALTNRLMAAVNYAQNRVQEGIYQRRQAKARQ